MTYEQREAIFAKDAISLTELTELLGVSKSAACKSMQAMKRAVGDRLRIGGYIHTQDYPDAMKLPDSDRYFRKAKEARGA